MTLTLYLSADGVLSPTTDAQVATVTRPYTAKPGKAKRFNLKFLDFAPIVHISALTGERTPKMLEVEEKVLEEPFGGVALHQRSGRDEPSERPERRVEGRQPVRIHDAVGQLTLNRSVLVVGRDFIKHERHVRARDRHHQEQEDRRKSVHNEQPEAFTDIAPEG